MARYRFTANENDTQARYVVIWPLQWQRFLDYQYLELGEVRVVSAEGLIGLKLQGFVNNSRRTQDLEDIKALVAANRQVLKMDEVREYFRLFDREALLEEILK